MGKKRRAAERHEDDLLVTPPMNTRTWQTGGDLFAEPLEHRNTCSRWVVVMTSVLLVLGGAAVAILARVEQDRHIFPLCPKCEDIILAMYITGGAIAAVGLVGVAAAFTRRTVVAVAYVVLIVLFALLCIAAGSAVAVYYSGLHRDDLKTLWTDAVRDEPEVICDLQTTLKCSGFDRCCTLVATAPASTAPTTTTVPAPPARFGAVAANAGGDSLLQAFTAANGTTAAPAFPFPNACNITAAEYAQQCSPRCTDTNGQFQVTCSAQAQEDLKEHLAVVLGVIFGVAALLVITAIAAVRMTRKS